VVFWLYHFGLRFRDGPLEGETVPAGMSRWNDAEHFLEHLDACAGGNAEAQRSLQSLWSKTRTADDWRHFGDDAVPGPLPAIEEISRDARRIIAAACSSFLDGLTEVSIPSLERWEPYLRWADQLTSDDTVVSFNYDCVVELACAAARKALHVPGPAPESETEGTTSPEPQASGRPRLLKLHGSTDWVRDATGRVRQVTVRSPDSLLAENVDVVIATPGNAKRQMADTLLAGLWGQAQSALAGADEVHFIGYRFPESDAFALCRLLDAIKERADVFRSGQTPRLHLLKVHTVLGPEVNGRDSSRLGALLRRAVDDPRCVIQHALDTLAYLATLYAR